MCLAEAMSTVTSIAVGTHCVHFGDIMHILSTGRYSLCAKRALYVRGQYRRVLTMCGNGIKRPCSVPAAGGRTWSGEQFVTLKPVNLGEVGFSVTILAQRMWTRGSYNGI